MSTAVVSKRSQFNGLLTVTLLIFIWQGSVHAHASNKHCTKAVIEFSLAAGKIYEQPIGGHPKAF
jgi:hypothetical protein